MSEFGPIELVVIYGTHRGKLEMRHVCTRSIDLDLDLFLSFEALQFKLAVPILVQGHGVISFLADLERKDDRQSRSTRLVSFDENFSLEVSEDGTGENSLAMQMSMRLPLVNCPQQFRNLESFEGFQMTVYSGITISVDRLSIHRDAMQDFADWLRQLVSKDVDLSNPWDQN